MVGSVWMMVCVAFCRDWAVGRVVWGPWLVRIPCRRVLVERAERVFEAIRKRTKPCPEQYLWCPGLCYI